MAAVPIQIDGVLWDVAQKKGTKVTLIGQASIVGLSVGGGPIMPPDATLPPDPGGHPEHPIWGPPGINLPPGPGFPPVAGHPLPPIESPPPNVDIPPPGSPPVILPGVRPVQPMVPPPAIVVEYPGIGKVLVPQPVP